MTFADRSINRPPADLIADIVGVILAGGRSRRFGSPKIDALLGGATLLERGISVHRAVFRTVLVVANHLERDRAPGVEVLSDVQPGSGPIGGLLSGLLRARELGAEGICCSPCDAPFLNPGLLRFLVEKRETFPIVVPERPGTPPFEPLVGWYSCETIPAIENALAEGRLAMHRLIGRCEHVRIIPRRDLVDRFDPDSSFFNVNTREDLELARRIHQRSGR